MAVPVNLVKDDVRVTGYVGFSWTVFFFGFFVPLFRGDWKWFLIMFFIGVPTFGLVNLAFCFLYNGIYTRSLLEDKGYRPADDYSKRILADEGLIWDNM